MRTLEYLKEKIKNNEERISLLNDSRINLSKQKRKLDLELSEMYTELEMDKRIIEFIDSQNGMGNVSIKVDVTTKDSHEKEFIFVQKPPLTWCAISNMEYKQLSDVIIGNSLNIDLTKYDESHALDMNQLKLDVADALELVVPLRLKK